MNRITIALGILLFSLSSHAETRPNIFEIYNQFTTSSIAAKRCDKPTEEEWLGFLGNYQMIITYYFLEARKKYPRLTDKDIANHIRKVNDKAKKIVSNYIDKNGCKNKEIQQLVKRFHIQAKWQPLKTQK